MSLAFVIILFIILAVDFLVALFGNVCPNGENCKTGEKILRLSQKYAVIFGGYTAVGLIAYFCGKSYPSMEYIGGLLLDPIFRYAISLLDRLKMLMMGTRKPTGRLGKADLEKVKKETEEQEALEALEEYDRDDDLYDEEEDEDEEEEEILVTLVKEDKAPAKAAAVKKAEPVMIEIEPIVVKETPAPKAKPKAKPRARKAAKEKE